MVRLELVKPGILWPYASRFLLKTSSGVTTAAVIKRKDLFKPTFQKLDQLAYDYRLSKTNITDPGYHTLNANLKGQAQAKVTFRLGGCSWKMEAARKDAGQMPQEVKSGIFSGVIINTVLAALLLNYLERGRRLAKAVDTDYLTSVIAGRPLTGMEANILINIKESLQLVP